MKGAEVRTQRPVIADDESSGRLTPSLHAIHEVYAAEGDATPVGYFVDGLGYFDKATAEAKGFDIDALAEGRTPATFAPQAKP